MQGVSRLREHERGRDDRRKVRRVERFGKKPAKRRYDRRAALTACERVRARPLAVARPQCDEARGHGDAEHAIHEGKPIEGATDRPDASAKSMLPSAP